MSGIIGISPNMKSGVVGKYPVGHVVQTIIVHPNTGAVTLDNEASGPPWTEIDTDFRITMTPRSVTNKIIIHANLLVGCNNSPTILKLRIIEVAGGTMITTGSTAGTRTQCHAAVRQKPHDANDNDMMQMMTVHEPAGSGERIYAVQAINEASSTVDRYFFGQYSSTSNLGYCKPFMSAMEIQV